MSDNNTIKCPTCGDEFSGERGMKIHHARVHNESIAEKKIECYACSTAFSKRASSIKEHTRHFCCKSCRVSWQQSGK